jgi:glycosyltransferase involved in cell wall biosynthesis
MKITHVISYFQPKLGYQEYYLAREQQKMGHEVSIVTSNSYYPFYHQPLNLRYSCANNAANLEGGLKVYRLPTIFEIGTYCAIRNIKKVLSKISPDIIHAHEIYTVTPSLPAFFKDGMRYKYLIDTHTYMPFYPKNVKSIANRLLFKFFKNILFNFAVKKADAIVAIDDNHQKWFSDEFKVPSDNIYVVPLGADHHLFKPDPKMRKESRLKLGINDSEILIVYAGKIIPSKDTHTLFYAYAHVAKTRKNAKLLLIGRGDPSYINKLISLSHKLKISNNVLFHPPVSNIELPKFYNAADIGVWPGSRSITIIEAMATGLPVVVARNDPFDGYPYAHNAKRYLEYENGLSFTRGNVNELSFCIEYLIDNEKIRLEMGHKSRKLVEDKLNWEALTKNLMEIYENIA